MPCRTYLDGNYVYVSPIPSLMWLPTFAHSSVKASQEHAHQKRFSKSV